jgi:hypothetical protein
LVTLYVLFRYLDWALVLYMACMAAGSVAWLVPSLRRLNHPEEVMVIGDGATPPTPPQSA